MTTGDVESAVRRKRRNKCIAYIVVGVIAQTLIIVVFALVVFKIKTPSVKLSDVKIESLKSGNSTFDIRFNAKIAIKNKNYGHFKFEQSTATISYQGTTVGEVQIPKARAKAKSTKRIDITIEANSNKLSGSQSQLSSDISSGTLVLSSKANLSGKVHLFKIMKKRKSASMDCSITVNLKSQAINKLSCK